MGSIRILIAEDDHLVRHLLGIAIKREPDMEVIGEADGNQEAISGAIDLRPDVLVLNLLGPQLDGLAVVQRLLQRRALPRVLMLTAEDDQETVLRAVRAGVKSFLSKLAATQFLTEAIRVVATGGSWIDQWTTRRLADELAFQVDVSPQLGRRGLALSEREREVLTCIASGFTNAQIAERLFLSEHTVKVHVRSILHKLDLTNRTQAALFAAQTGLLKQSPTTKHELLRRK
jgi:DNA-binding NarL/FixJ family response regulator